MSERLQEKCAVTAIVTANDDISASELARNTLLAMQNRGAEATGIVSRLADGTLEAQRENGLVHEVYSTEDIRRLAGTQALGHNRYSTSGSKHRHPQPVKDSSIGFAFAHNGNLPVTQRLETDLSINNIRTQTLNDSEMMSHAISQRIRTGHNIVDAVTLAYPLFKGAFSCVAMHDGTTVAFRDSRGIRPLAIGTFDGSYAITSETCGLDIIDATYDREVKPGEMVIITSSGIEGVQLADPNPKLDIFEFVYFARRNSLLYGQRVDSVRRRFGENLAKEHPPLIDDHSNILVVPVPETSTPAAQGYAKELGLDYVDAIEKNRYSNRSFMQPTQKLRRSQLRLKHSVIPELIQGRDVVLIDDSIVRLNTLPRLVEQAYLLGAKSVSTLVASPPVRFPDFYGIDMPSQDELAAANSTIEQMRKKLGSNYLGFLSLSRMVSATGIPADQFNLAAFNGEYPIGIGHHAGSIRTPVDMTFAD